MIKELVKIANKLDSVGLTKEADYLDAVIRKLSQKRHIGYHTVFAGETFSEIVEGYGDEKVSLQEQIALNKERNPAFNPDKLSVGQRVALYTPSEGESN